MQWFFKNFDEDSARCLFCQNECDVQSSSLAPANYHENKYTCRTCQEYYTIYIFAQSSVKETDELMNLSHIYDFSCGDFVVSLGSPGRTDLLAIRKRLSHHSIQIPKFEIDLSDKEKLLEKLKTYLLFS